MLGLMKKEGRLRGQGGVFRIFFQKSTFWLFLIEETDIYQMLLVP